MSTALHEQDRAAMKAASTTIGTQRAQLDVDFPTELTNTVRQDTPAFFPAIERAAHLRPTMAEHTAARHTNGLTAARRLDSVNKTTKSAPPRRRAPYRLPFTIDELTRRARVSRRFIYDHPELHAEAERRSAQGAGLRAATISASARVTLSSPRADLAIAKAANHRLDTELTTLRQRLGQQLGHSVLAEIAHAIIDAPTSNNQLAELEQAVVQAGEELTQRTEELVATRQINGELTPKVNRRRA